MTEKTDQTEQHPAPSGQLSIMAVGRLLTEARESAGLTLDEVAARLRLMPRQVKALESGDMDALPGQAFVRGFLRNYAKLLQIDAEPLLEAYRAQAPDAAQAQISLHSENILIVGGERKGWMVYLAASAVVALALAGWLAYTDTPRPQEARPVAAPLPKASTDSSPAAEILPAAPFAPATPPAASVPATPPSPAEEQKSIVPAPATQSESAPAAAASARLTLAASQSSWVSVRDRDGKEIFNRTVSAGSRETVEGVPPFNLVLGNANGMQVSFNDKPVDLAPHIRANVARLTLE